MGREYLVETAIDVMGNAYPDVVKNREFILGVLTREEERFRHTLKTGLSILDDELGAGAALSGSTAFLLHDTYGFPLELTRELALERGLPVDEDRFETLMARQRERSRHAVHPHRPPREEHPGRVRPGAGRAGRHPPAAGYAVRPVRGPAR